MISYIYRHSINKKKKNQEIHSPYEDFILIINNSIWNSMLLLLWKKRGWNMYFEQAFLPKLLLFWRYGIRITEKSRQDNCSLQVQAPSSRWLTAFWDSTSVKRVSLFLNLKSPEKMANISHFSGPKGAQNELEVYEMCAYPKSCALQQFARCKKNGSKSSSRLL